MQDIHPISGWSLNYIVSLDVHDPGLAGAFFRASNERRQVIATLFACRPAPTSKAEALELADLAKRATHREILIAAVGQVPTGLRGALARSGAQPHPKQFYRCLHHVLSAQEHSAAAAVIKRLGSIDLLRLRILLRLPVGLQSANLVTIISSVRMAADVAKLTDLLRNRGVELAAFADALATVSSLEQLAEICDRWCQKIAFPPHPLPPSEQYRPIGNGVELRRLALRYRNCAKRYLPQSLEGITAFGEFIWSGQQAVLHLEKRDGKWALEGIFGKDNMPVDQDLYSSAISYLANHDIRPTRSERRPTGEWGVLRRLSNPAALWF